MNRAIIDLETGGFSITKNGVCEIGVLIIDEYYNTIMSASWIIRPYTKPCGNELVSYKEEAMAIHGITTKEIEKGLNVIGVCKSLKDILNIYKIETVIGHNFRLFDNPRLKYLVERFTEYKFEYDILDTLEEIPKRTLKLDSYSLESLCKYYGIINNDCHRALGDCYVTLELLKKFGL